MTANDDLDRIAVLHDRKQERRGHRLYLVPFDEIVLGTQPQYLVKGLIPRVGLTVIWGPPKSGKSFWTFDLAIHVALGWPYRERRVQQGPVVYCAFEGQTGIEARVEAFRKTFPIGEPVPFYLEPVTLDLVADHAELIATVKRQLETTAPVLVVLDTLNRSLRGSENDDKDMSAYVRAADIVRATFKCAVAIVHHCGIAGTRPRGHTALTGAVDAQLSVGRDGSDIIIVEVELAKDGPQGDKIASTLKVVEVGKDDDGEIITSCVVVPADLPETSKTSKAPRLPKAAQIALRALHEAMGEIGAVPPVSAHVPTGVRVVGIDAWRTYAYAKGISGGEIRAKQKAFKSGYEHLVAGGHVGVWDEQAWPVKSKDQSNGNDHRNAN